MPYFRLLVVQELQRHFRNLLYLLCEELLGGKN